MVNTHDYQAGAGQEQQLLVSFLQWDWVFLAPMILILSGVWSVVNAHDLHSQLASPILLSEDWDYHYYNQSINMLQTSSSPNIKKIFVSM